MPEYPNDGYRGRRSPEEQPRRNSSRESSTGISRPGSRYEGRPQTGAPRSRSAGYAPGPAGTPRGAQENPPPRNQPNNYAPRNNDRSSAAMPVGRRTTRLVDVLILVGVLIVAILVIAPLVEKRYEIGMDDSQSAGEAPADKGLTITEVMSSNRSALCSKDGNYYDWVELTNTADHTLSLQGYGLTDRLDRSDKYTFGKATLEPGERIVVFCSGLTDGVEGEHHAPFKLSATGDTVYLTNTYGNAIQALNVPELGADISYALDSLTESWRTFEKYTPGYENDETGWEAYWNSIHSQDGRLYINEIMAGNNVTIKDGTGYYHDWVEIYNASEEKIDLSGWGLSDRERSPKRWVFPEGTTIKAGEYMIVYCSKLNTVDETGNLHTSFGLSSSAETVVLANKEGLIVDTVSYAMLDADQSYQRSSDGSWITSTKATPGYPNTEDGYRAYAAALVSQNTSGIYISEVMNNNTDTVADEFGNYGSWVEITNRGNQLVNLGGFGLTDDTGSLGKWRFPDMMIGPGEKVLIFCNSKGTSGAFSAQEKLNANFSISSSGETLVLTDSNNQVLDVCQMGWVPGGMSYARAEGEMNYCYMTTPTPGENARGDSYTGMCQTPEILQQGGIFNEGVIVTVYVPENTQVYYTTDCTEPTESSNLYTGPISVATNSVIRVKAFRLGFLPSRSDSATYLIGEDTTLPIVCLTAEPDDLWSDEKGIYAYGTDYNPKFPYRGANFTQDWERDAHIEMYETDNSVCLDQNFGLRIFGAYSRGHVKKSLACMARGGYGTAYFEYPLFDSLPYDEYKSFVLRSGASEWHMTMIRDVVNNSLATEFTEVLAQTFRPVVVYLNGSYWGVYFLQEKINAQFLSQHTGVDADSFNILVGNGNKAAYVKQGSNEDYMALLDYVTNNDCSQAAVYEQVKTKVDVQNFIDYMLMEMYTGNTDTGNIKFYMSPELDGRWRWIFFDTDWSILPGNVDDNMVEEYLNPKGHGSGNMFHTTLQCNLIKNAEFRSLFLERAAYMVNTVFNPDTYTNRINEIAEMLDPEMERDRTFWNQYSQDNENSGKISYDGWVKMVSRLREFVTARPNYFKQHVRDTLNMTDEEFAKYFGE